MAVTNALAPAGPAGLAERFAGVRQRTELLAEPLSAEDQCIQSMADVSPTKWHRAHGSWFFEEFCLKPNQVDAVYDERYSFLFNSYYEGVGPRHTRSERGVISRPGAEEIGRYRREVDQRMLALLDGPEVAGLTSLTELGIHHEQQHQELLLMDIKHVLSCNPFLPAYQPALRLDEGKAPAHAWIEHAGGLVDIGHAGDGFAFDNEGPRHAEFLYPFRIGSRPVTNEEWLTFMADGGYHRPELWLSEGWATTSALGWEAPLYWTPAAGEWEVFTLGGRRPLQLGEPVCHVSYYEADAYARWAGHRLPTEAEWEVVAREQPVAGGLADLAHLHPRPARPAPGLQQLFGDVWEWTASPYVAYRGFRPLAGAVGEYNGKFMVNQQVLRGGSCATPEHHIRPTYRNFFPAPARWAFSGLRLAAG